MEVPQFIFDGFKKHFDTTTIFPDAPICLVTGKYSFDLFGFEKWLTGYGYSRGAPGSIASFVTEHFGAEAEVFVQKILNLNL